MNDVDNAQHLEPVIKRFSPAECPKSPTWFADGGRCGWAHCCKECTGDPNLLVQLHKKKQRDLTYSV